MIRSAAVIGMLALVSPAAAASERASCGFGPAPPVACTVTFDVGRSGTTVLTARGGGRSARFVGRRDSGWWSGLLDGRPAMAFERNRGNVVFATRDLRHRFEYATAGNERGSY